MLEGWLQGLYLGSVDATKGIHPMWFSVCLVIITLMTTLVAIISGHPCTCHKASIAPPCYISLGPHSTALCPHGATVPHSHSAPAIRAGSVLPFSGALGHLERRWPTGAHAPGTFSGTAGTISYDAPEPSVPTQRRRKVSEPADSGNFASSACYRRQVAAGALIAPATCYTGDGLQVSPWCSVGSL